MNRIPYFQVTYLQTYTKTKTHNFATSTLRQSSQSTKIGEVRTDKSLDYSLLKKMLDYQRNLFRDLKIQKSIWRFDPFLQVGHYGEAKPSTVDFLALKMTKTIRRKGGKREG